MPDTDIASKKVKHPDPIIHESDLAGPSGPATEPTRKQAPTEADANLEHAGTASTQPSGATAPTQSSGKSTDEADLPLRQDPSYQGNGKTKETVVEAPPKHQKGVIRKVDHAYVVSIGLRDHCQPDHCRHSIGTWPTRASAEQAVQSYANQPSLVNRKVILEIGLERENEDPTLFSWLAGPWQTERKVISQHAPSPVMDLQAYWIRIERVRRNDFVNDNADELSLVGHVKLEAVKSKKVDAT
jgi:hypothetical protein